MARSAPVGPEVDENRGGRGSLDDIRGKALLGDVHGTHSPVTTTSAAQPAMSAAGTCSPDNAQ